MLPNSPNQGASIDRMTGKGSGQEANEIPWPERSTRGRVLDLNFPVSVICLADFAPGRACVALLRTALESWPGVNN